MFHPFSSLETGTFNLKKQNPPSIFSSSKLVLQSGTPVYQFKKKGSQNSDLLEVTFCVQVPIHFRPFIGVTLHQLDPQTGAVQVQLASLPPPIAEPGPAAPPSAAAVARENPPELPLALPNGKVFEIG